MLLLLVYTFVFSAVLQVRWGVEAAGERSEFALTLFAGLIPFTVFSEVVGRAPGLVLGHPSYVKRTIFPLEALPVAALGSALVHSLISIAILLAATAIVLGRISPSLPLLPLAYVPLVLLTLGLAWLLASLGVYLRDIGQAVAVGLQLLFFVTPIVYPPASVPEGMRIILHLNPMTTVVDGFRDTLLWGRGLPWAAWAGWTAASAVAALGGWAWFARTKKGFAAVM
jgi:lipopolysaccharide transport system permease protein